MLLSSTLELHGPPASHACLECLDGREALGALPADLPNAFSTYLPAFGEETAYLHRLVALEWWI